VLVQAEARRSHRIGNVHAISRTPYHMLDKQPHGAFPRNFKSNCARRRYPNQGQRTYQCSWTLLPAWTSYWKQQYLEIPNVLLFSLMCKRKYKKQKDTWVYIYVELPRLAGCVIIIVHIYGFVYLVILCDLLSPDMADRISNLGTLGFGCCPAIAAH
jgi:hypothetical protein